MHIDRRSGEDEKRLMYAFPLTWNVQWQSFSTQSTQSSLSAANTIVLSCVSTQNADMLSCKQHTRWLYSAPSGSTSLIRHRYTLFMVVYTQSTTHREGAAQWSNKIYSCSEYVFCNLVSAHWKSDFKEAGLICKTCDITLHTVGQYCILMFIDFKTSLFLFCTNHVRHTAENVWTSSFTGSVISENCKRQSGSPWGMPQRWGAVWPHWAAQTVGPLSTFCPNDAGVSWHDDPIHDHLPHLEDTWQTLRL